jgi:hypothetical protein
MGVGGTLPAATTTTAALLAALVAAALAVAALAWKSLADCCIHQGRICVP